MDNRKMDKGEASGESSTKNVNDDVYEDIMAWIDDLPLSRQKKNMSKDFSDGVMMAEILKIYYPKHVELHNYVAANSKSTKIDNWVVLNRKVLSKLDLKITKKTINRIVTSVPGEIQKLLLELRTRILNDEKADNDPNTRILYYGDKEDGSRVEIVSIPIISAGNDQVVTGHQKMVALVALEKKSKQLAALREEVSFLTERVTHLESLVELKDQRIRDLNCQLCRRQSTDVFSR